MSNINSNPDKVTQTQNAPKKSYALTSLLITLLSLATLVFCDKLGIFFADIALICIVPCMYFCVLVKSDNLFSKILPGIAILLGSFVCIARAFSQKDNATFFMTACLYGLLSLTLCAIFFYAYSKYVSKTGVFASVSVAVCIFSLINYALSFFISTGKFSVSAMVSDINQAFDTVKTAFITQLTGILENKETLDLFASTLKTAGVTDEITAQTIISNATQSYEMILSAIKMCIPSAIAIISMISATLVIFALSLFAKLYKIKLCDAKGKWEYTISTVSTRVFNIAIFVALIGGFFSLPKVFIVTALNLAIILMLPLDFIAIKGILQFLKSRNFNRALRFVVCIVALVIFSTFMQGYGLMILAFIGVYITNYKERMELFRKYTNSDSNDNNDDENRQ